MGVTFEYMGRGRGGDDKVYGWDRDGSKCVQL